jgi:hypothetical protein
MSYGAPPRWRVQDLVLTPYSDACSTANGSFLTLPASGTWALASRAIFYPMFLHEPFTVAKAFVVNGATVGTDSWDLGIYQMTDQSTGRLDLLRSTGAVVSAGTINQAAEVSAWKVAATNITSGNDSTDSATYTTASITMKAGRLYLMSAANTAASAGTISSITNTGGPTFSAAPATSTTQYNGTAHRVSIWYCVPTVDYTGTLVITFGATQTACTWSLNEFSGVDTTTNGGIVQAVVGTGTSVTPAATLAAFGSANNATFGALSNVSDTTTTPGTGFTELSDTATTTPVVCLETEWTVANDTSVDGTITSAAWGAVAVEIKADASPFVIPPSLPGMANIYMAMTVNGTTATFFRQAPTIGLPTASGVLFRASTFPLPSNCIPTTVVATQTHTPLAGFSSRTLLA